MFLGKDVLKICSRFTAEHPYQSAISIWHGCSLVNFLPIFRAPFTKNTSGGLLLKIQTEKIHLTSTDNSAFEVFQNSYFPRPEMFDDGELLLQDGWPTKGVQPYFQPGPLPFSLSQISNTPRSGFESLQNLSSWFVERSCAVVITTILRCHSTLAFHGILIVFRSMFPFNYVIERCFQIHIKRTPLGSQKWYLLRETS